MTFQTFKDKAPGLDTMKKIHIKHFPKLLLVIITKLFNYCLSTGYYPNRFKQGLMIFIPKPGKDHSNPANYRPITLLNLLSKAFGKILNKRFVQHLERHDLQSSLQYGFRKGRGTASSLALIYETVARRKGNTGHHKVSIVSTDISGAFDRVWHQKLVVLLHKLSLPELYIKIFANFLSNREIRIKIFNYIGPAFSPEAGVPQGAPDSPDLFNITTLPLLEFHPSPNTYAPWYCDDHHMIVATPCNKRSKALHRAQIVNTIKNENVFERKRGILTCVAKSIITPIAQRLTTMYLEFNQFNEHHRYPFLTPGASTKILGLYLTANSFTATHVTELHKKADSIISMLYCMGNLDAKAKIHIVKALVISTLTYPDTVLLTCSPSGFHTLQKALNRALKWVYDIRYPTVIKARDLHLRAEMKPLNQIIYQRGRNMWDKIMDGTAADQIYATELIQRDDFTNPHSFFPSSYDRSRLAEPPPNIHFT